MKRWSRRAVLVGSVGCLVAACIHGQAGNVAYSVGVSGEGNEVTIVQDSNGVAGAYIARIQSARGIGQANIGWWGNEAPHQLSFEVALGGLEEFALRWAETTVYVSVNSTDGQVLQRLVGPHAGEVEITATSPYWLSVDKATATRASYLLGAPVAFLDDAPRLWSISWIDFYR